MFEQLRRSLEDLLERATKPEDRRMVLGRMKDTLVQAKVGLEDLRDAPASSRRKLDVERRELSTVKRRKELAAGINDAETVAVAERFERQHEERVRVLEEKVIIQTREVELGERELEEMKAELRKAMAGIPPAPGAAQVEDPLGESDDAQARSELDALARERARQERDAAANRRLEELKRRMGK